MRCWMQFDRWNSYLSPLDGDRKQTSTRCKTSGLMDSHSPYLPTKSHTNTFLWKRRLGLSPCRRNFSKESTNPPSPHNKTVRFPLWDDRNGGTVNRGTVSKRLIFQLQQILSYAIFQNPPQQICLFPNLKDSSFYYWEEVNRAKHACTLKAMH